MANRFVTGEKITLKIVPTGGAGGLMNVKGVTLDEEGVVADVSHTGTGGRTARITGKGDHKVTVNYDFDLDLKPYNAPFSIRFGSLGILLIGYDAAFPIQIPYVVTKTHAESAMESEIKGSFDAQENVLAGVVIYPTS